MAEERFEERTEQATPRKRQKAREKGQVPRSRELISMAGTGGIIIAFYLSGDYFIKNLSDLVKKTLSLEYGIEPFAVMRYATTEMFLLLAPFFALSVSFILISGFSQGGFVMRPLSLDMERLNPLNGLKRLFSFTGLTETIKSIFKFLIGGMLFYAVIKKSIGLLPLTMAMEIRESWRVSEGLIARAILYGFLTFFTIAIIDYILERWRFERSIRMTRQEIREEHKETEGDPLIRSRIKSLQREMARRRMMQEVPKATVVITNPTHIAVALLYKREEMDAPRVIAKGAGLIAEKIKEIALSHNIPVVEDKPLARSLYKLDIGSFIPEELYRAVARVLAHIYRMRRAA